MSFSSQTSLAMIVGAQEVPITLVIGGARSGKTAFSEQLVLGAEDVRESDGRDRSERNDWGEGGYNRKYIYVATCPRQLDGEMDERIARHRSQRSDRFVTVENRLDLLGIATEHQGATLLLDCLTLWLFMKQESQRDSQDILADLRRELSASSALVRWVIVANEVGMGIVPADKLTRDFRDLAGWANQLVAQLPDRVILMVAGIPLAVKEKKNE